MPFTICEIFRFPIIKIFILFFLMAKSSTGRERGKRCVPSLSTFPVTMFDLCCQSFASNPFWSGFVTTPFPFPSFTSESHELGGTSTAGEQLKNPCGCMTNRRKGSSQNNSKMPLRLKFLEFENLRTLTTLRSK